MEIAPTPHPEPPLPHPHTNHTQEHITSWLDQVTSAVLAYNPRVRDGNRPGKQRLECVLTMLDGTRVRLYPGAKAIVEDSKFVSDRGDAVAARDPHSNWQHGHHPFFATV